MSGIYQLSVGTHFYFGQAKNLARREAQHRRDLEAGRHYNPYLQRAYDAHGEFEFTVACECAPSELDRLEQEMLDAFWGTEGCTNVASCAATHRTGAVLTSSTKDQISQSLKRHFQTAEGQAQRIALSERAKADGRGSRLPKGRSAVRAVLLDGTEIDFNSHTAAAKHFGITRGAVSAWLAGRARPASRHQIASISPLKGS